MADVDSLIKEKIAETLVEEFFKEAGFYVLRLGKESATNPLASIEQFVKTCKGNFNFQKEDADFISPLTYLQKLPTFVVLAPNGRMEFIEVKFRHNALLLESDDELFDVFARGSLVVVNQTVDDSIIEVGCDEDKQCLSALKTSRLHIWNEFETDDEDELGLGVSPLTFWLTQEFEIEKKELFDKYERLAAKWLSRN